VPNADQSRFSQRRFSLPLIAFLAERSIIFPSYTRINRLPHVANQSNQRGMPARLLCTPLTALFNHMKRVVMLLQFLEEAGTCAKLRPVCEPGGGVRRSYSWRPGRSNHTLHTTTPHHALSQYPWSASSDSSFKFGLLFKKSISRASMAIQDNLFPI
jgi:hypothetical protein